MRTCDGCIYFEKVGKTIVRSYFDGRPAEVLLADNCLLHDWCIPEDSDVACEAWMTKEDLCEEIELAREILREETQEMMMGSDYYDNKYDTQGVK